MENPEQEIEGIVRDLCQKTRAKQDQALAHYFAEDASFIHPFCRVPSFNTEIPIVRLPVNSRQYVRAIFRWYRMMSPKIVLDVDSVTWDRNSNKMYVQIRQTFRLRYLPFWAARVKLVTVLDLVPCTRSANGEYIRRGTIKENGYTETSAGSSSAGGSKASGQSKSGPEGKQVASPNNGNTDSDGSDERVFYLIRRQEDLYQVNDSLSFLAPWFNLGSGFWYIIQVWVAAVCYFLSLFRLLTSWGREKPVNDAARTPTDFIEKLLSWPMSLVRTTSTRVNEKMLVA